MTSQRIQNKNNLPVRMEVLSVSLKEMKLGVKGQLRGWLFVIAAVIAILTVCLWQIHGFISESLHWH
jgi:hypothetical protein